MSGSALCKGWTVESVSVVVHCVRVDSVLRMGSEVCEDGW